MALYVPTDWVDGVTPVNAANLDKLEAGVAAAVPQADVVTASGIIIANKLLAADGQPAWQVKGDGRMEWGPGGSTAIDTNLYRVGVSILQTDGSFWANKDGRFGWTGSAWSFHVSQGDGKLYIGGTDVNLYRLGSDQLATDDRLFASRDVVANLNKTNMLALGEDGRIYFGQAQDTNLYRSAANELRTDDALTVLGVFECVGGRLGQTAKSITDWNTAIDNGWYMASPGTNAPAALTNWVIGLTHNHGAAGYCVQRVFDFTAGTPSQVWERRQMGGTWGAWSADLVATQFISQQGLAGQIQIANDGRIYFGSAMDTNLFRSGANQLATDDNFMVGGGALYLISASGTIYLGTSQDVNLYRYAADNLATDDLLSIRRALSTDWGFAIHVGAEAQDRYAIKASGTVEWGDGTNARDTNLYRNNADT